jgi:squalene-hopene/tetraprenyl-beta-curcumene cyclase
MSWRRSRVAALIVLPLVASLSACRSRGEDLGGQVDRALGAAIRFLISSQSADGAWRSATYGVFKDGLSLTPVVLKAVAFGPEVAGSATARRRGAEYLAARVRADGSIDDGPIGMTYPVYTAAAAVIALTHLDFPVGRSARDAWLRELRRRQLTEELGWQPDDPAYGGWGYSIEPTPKSNAVLDPAGQVDADLSSTLFAVGALRIAGVAADAPAIRKALTFIERCQNLAARDQDGDSRYDDGGFFFSRTDPVRNKAGVAGTDRHGRLRYHSYGSTTADGLRALLRCGLAQDHRRVAAARAWLEGRFSAAFHPGKFEAAREGDRDATYFYYAWSVAHAFRSLGIVEIHSRGQRVAWAEVLSQELIRRQRADGSWTNRFTASKEDDPKVATSFAVGALGICRTLEQAQVSTTDRRGSFP